MRVIVQRSLNSSVSVDNKIVGSINSGLVLLVGFTSIILSLKSSIFGHDFLCTLIPYPFVIYPIISSPGIGLHIMIQ